MRQRLQPHPDTPCPALQRIEIDMRRPATRRLELDFSLIGDVDALALPPPLEQARADGLWRRTCFEAFIWTSAGAGYIELNAAPSRLWAAYAFDDYRAGMRTADLAPRIDVERGGDRFMLRLAVTLHGDEQAWAVKPTAVIETSDGALSYWASEHPPGKPDFHQRIGTIALAPAPGQT